MNIAISQRKSHRVTLSQQRVCWNLDIFCPMISTDASCFAYMRTGRLRPISNTAEQNHRHIVQIFLCQFSEALGKINVFPDGVKVLIIGFDCLFADTLCCLGRHKFREKFLRRSVNCLVQNTSFCHKVRYPAFLINEEIGRVSDFFQRKEETPENVVFSRVWCSSGDSNPGHPA